MVCVSGPIEFEDASQVEYYRRQYSSQTMSGESALISRFRSITVQTIDARTWIITEKEVKCRLAFVFGSRVYTKGKIRRVVDALGIPLLHHAVCYTKDVLLPVI